MKYRELTVEEVAKYIDYLSISYADEIIASGETNDKEMALVMAKEELNDAILSTNKMLMFINDENIEIGRAWYFFTTFKDYDTRAIFISDIIVNPEYRQMGYGKQILDEIENITKEKEIRYLGLTISHNNLVAKQLFLSRGFTLYRENTFNDILIKKVL